MLQLVHGLHDSSGHEVASILEQVNALIDSYSLNAGGAEVLSEFHACLMKLANTSSGHLVFSDTLTNRVIVGVSKRRGHAIKYLLSSEQYQTVEQSRFEALPGWGNGTDILEALLHFRNSVTNMEDCQRGGARREGGVVGSQEVTACRQGEVGSDVYPLDLSVKLGLLDVLRLLVDAGMKMCPCSATLHYAVINHDRAAMEYVLQRMLSEWTTTSVQSRKARLCNLLAHSELSFGRSPLDIAYFQCESGLSCDTFTYILDWMHATCAGNYSLEGFPYGHMTCPASHALVEHTHGVSLKERWLRCVVEGRGCDFGELTGRWRVYGNHSVGRMDCPLTRIVAGSLTPVQFERDFVNLR